MHVSFLNSLKNLMHPFSQNKLINILIYLFFKMVYFSWSEPWNIPHFCWEQGRIYLFFSNASEIKAGAEDSLDILEDFLLILSVSLTPWMSLFGDSSCDSGSSDRVRGMDMFFTTIIQEGGKNLCTLRSAGNQMQLVEMTDTRGKTSLPAESQSSLVEQPQILAWY